MPARSCGPNGRRRRGGVRGAARRTPPRRLSRENFHDRFLVIDDRELYLIGASLKDLGRKCFGFTKMDASEIPGLKARM